MPPWKSKLTDDQIALLARYTVNPQTETDGAALFQSNCSKCHGDRIPSTADVASATAAITGGGAQLEHLRLQRENTASLHVATLEARQHRDSRLLSHSVSLGARLARHDLQVRFEDEGGDSVLNGLYFGSGDQLVGCGSLALIWEQLGEIRSLAVLPEFRRRGIGKRAKLLP